MAPLPARPAGFPPRPPVGRTLALALVLAGTLVLAVAPALAQPPRTTHPGESRTIVERRGDGLVPTTRYRGSQRFDTAQLIAEDTFSAAPDVLLARADLFPDALAGSYLAGHLDAPLLLTSSAALTPETADGLERLDAQRVTVLGGTAAIGEEVATELRERGYTVERVGGVDRFETARMVATHDAGAVGEREGEGATAVVARADEFPDALVTGSVSYAAGFPLLLTQREALHPQSAAALDELGIEHVLIPGGTAAVSEGVRADIEDRGITVERVAGSDRVATSVAFAYFARDELGFSLDRLNMARGDLFPDALTLGPPAGVTANPIVLTTSPTTLGGGGSVAELLAETCEVSGLRVAGGFAAVHPHLEQEMRRLATATGATCDIDFQRGGAGTEVLVNPLGSDHEVTVTVVDNAGGPAADEADVRFEVYRGVEGADEGTFTLVESTTATTQDQRATFGYTGPDTGARDYVLACTTSTATDDPGQAPASCTAPVAGEPVDALVVLGGSPQNVAGGLAWSYQIKEWSADATAPGDAELLAALFCDTAEPLDDLLAPCTPHEDFGDDVADFLQLTFDREITDLADVEDFEGSITLTQGNSEVTFESTGAADLAVQFLTSQSFEQLDGDDLLRDLLTDLNEDQLLVVIVNPAASPQVDDVIGESVTDLQGITGIDGNPVVVDDPAAVNEHDITLGL